MILDGLPQAIGIAIRGQSKLTEGGRRGGKERDRIGEIKTLQGRPFALMHRLSPLMRKRSGMPAKTLPL
jgi:hypothetical protein